MIKSMTNTTKMIPIQESCFLMNLVIEHLQEMQNRRSKMQLRLCISLFSNSGRK
jgi:hypothetical protein